MVRYLDKNSGLNQWNFARNAKDNKKSSSFTRFLWYMFLLVVAWWFLGTMLTPKSANTDVAESVTVVDVSAVPVTVLGSDKINANVQGLRISDIALSDFAADASDKNTARMTLLGHDNEFIEVGFIGTSTTAPSATTVWTVSGDSYTWQDAYGVTYTRDIHANGYLVTLTDSVLNTTNNTISVTPYARIVRNNKASVASGVDTGMIAYVNSDTENVAWRSLDKKSYAFSTTNGFVGFADQYWETIVSIDSPDQTIRAKRVGDYYQADTSAAPVNIAPRDSKTIVTNIFVGPRDPRILAGISGTIIGAEDTMDYGWFWFLAKPMLWILNSLNAIFLNYGVAIIIMTLLLRLVMWPLTRKSYTSMIAMQKMQPEIARIQKLYANDKARQQMEMMRLYQTHKTSPMSGCLPMLIQIPIFFALYKALLVSVQMRSAHFLWISDLAAMDPYFILPIIMGGTMWFQQYLQNGAQKQVTGNDAMASTQRVMKWMPIIFTIMFAWMPAGLVLYWTVSNIFGIAQMYIIKHQEQ